MCDAFAPAGLIRFLRRPKRRTELQELRDALVDLVIAGECTVREAVEVLRARSH